eukprot:SAG11_NODE_5155_length_1644_cov_3.489320_2_plen_120_part_00
MNTHALWRHARHAEFVDRLLYKQIFYSVLKYHNQAADIRLDRGSGCGVDYYYYTLHAANRHERYHKGNALMRLTRSNSRLDAPPRAPKPTARRTRSERTANHSAGATSAQPASTLTRAR